ncbi:DUF6130 family protein [Thalassospira marina]|uniref:Uncharacterized protein n=1 Tax=Thalassospira marina TaxID=2048283 RepID=A0ABM6Q7N6_9PROT|nr:DUF6130 family protein [Thalassospira marina]AUG52532.1 hypothetical protein CSC3H3_07235 [Thalassospira marina]
MKPLAIATAIVLCLTAFSSANAAGHDHKSDANAQTTSSQHMEEAAPKLTVLAPDRETLKSGYVYLPFHVENMNIQPIYAEFAGEAATTLRPKIGHLHVMVDNAGWKWIHASTDPLYFGQLSPGPHQIELELVDAAHAVIEVQTIDITVPER